MQVHRLDGWTAYITGASAGIGAACAERIAGLGARVVIGARRKEKLDAVRARVEELHQTEVVALPLDVNDPQSVQRFLEEGERQAGPCDILVNNAGGAKGVGLVEDADLEDWQWMVDTNATALFRITRMVLPGMIERGRGDIVNIASIAGVAPYAKGSVYCAVKAAVQAFSESMRQETLGKNIRVFCFDPGLVETEFSVVRLGDAEQAKAVYEGLEPLTGEDVADCVEFGLSRPRRMCLDRMQIMATAQAGTRAMHRR
jgi:NADP-dependent 3-hydroxy acid dehydrogenase YdfG